MKIIIIYYPGFNIPSTIQICDNYVLHPDRLDIIQDNVVICSIPDYSHFDCYDVDDEEDQHRVVFIIKNLLKQFEQLDGEV